MRTDSKIYEFEEGEVSVRVEQETIHLKAISGADPVELTKASALAIAECLQQLVRNLRNSD